MGLWLSSRRSGVATKPVAAANALTNVRRVSRMVPPMARQGMKNSISAQELGMMCTPLYRSFIQPGNAIQG
jgi:hypothetical protein